MSNSPSVQVEYKFTNRDSDDMLADRLKNFFKVLTKTPIEPVLDLNEANTLQVAVYFEPDQSVITKITKDAKMTWSDKISWVRKLFYLIFYSSQPFQIGGNMGLFTGFSVISSIELLYWIWFKVDNWTYMPINCSAKNT